jgi:hypothetical protein
MKKLLLSLAAVTLLFTSCGKDDDNLVSRKAVITTGKWKLTAGNVSGTVSGVPINYDIFTVIEDCQKDDLGIFRPDMHFIVDAGAVKCDSADDQQTDFGTWSLVENDTKLQFPLDGIVPGVGANNTSTINYLDNATMKLSGTGTQDFGGTSYNFSYNITLAHVQ